MAVIAHDAVPGRLRLRDARLRRRPDLAAAAADALRLAPGVLAVGASAVTGSVLIRYAPPADGPRLAAALDVALDGGPPVRARSLSAAAAAAASEPDHAWHAMPPAAVCSHFGTAAPRGLTEAEAAGRLVRTGPNVLPRAEPRSPLAIFAEQLTSLPVALLGASAVVSVLTGGIADAAVIGGVVLLNAGIATTTEQQAERTIMSLSQSSFRPVAVRRGGRRLTVDPALLVPGDLLLVEPGTLVPADARLLEAHDLTVNESALTGESLPVHKDARQRVAPDAPLADRPGMLFRGTAVTGGQGVAVVTATGIATEIGRIHTLIGSVRPPETPIERQLGEVGRELVVINGAICGVIFALGLLRGQPVLQLVKNAISLGVAAVPEGLPAVATTTLAVGIQEMRRRNVLVRRLDAVETLGAVQVVAMDKTGTLTANRMAAVAVHVDGRYLELGEARSAGETERLLFETATLCSEVEAGPAPGDLRGSPTETALVRRSGELGGDLGELRARLPVARLVARAEGRKRMATLHRPRGGRALLAVKGDPAEVLARCTRLRVDGAECALDPDLRGAILAANDRMAGRALRVLGVARREGGGDPADERELTWLGLVGLADPLRPQARPAIAQMHRAGIRTVMITGDQAATAHAIARELNLGQGQDIRVLEAGALRELAPDVLAALAPQVQVFARVSPSNKLQIVQALQAGGLIVGMTGDGINDGPALRAAEIGIAMGAEGSDVAREVADLVLATDDMGGVIDAVRLGRATFANIRKVLRYLVATNASETLVMLGAALAGVAEPLTPMQLLWLNLVSDPLPALALGLEPPEPDVMEDAPHDPRAPILTRRDFYRLLREGSVIGTGALAAWFAGQVGPAARTATFHGLTLAQLAHALACRSETHGLLAELRRPANPKLVGALGICVALQASAQTVPPLRRLLGLGPMTPATLLAIAGAAAVPLALNEGISALLRRRDGTVGA